jgi:hypothetical protein
MQRGQWSVEIALRRSFPASRARAFFVPFLLSGGLMTYFAPSNPGSS